MQPGKKALEKTERELLVKKRERKLQAIHPSVAAMSNLYAPAMSDLYALDMSSLLHEFDLPGLLLHEFDLP